MSSHNVLEKTRNRALYLTIQYTDDYPLNFRRVSVTLQERPRSSRNSYVMERSPARTSTTWHHPNTPEPSNLLGQQIPPPLPRFTLPNDPA